LEKSVDIFVFDLHCENKYKKLNKKRKAFEENSSNALNLHYVMRVLLKSKVQGCEA
jgi:hypothetical protein